MGNLGDREFNLEGWGTDKRLIEGPCGHCHHAVAFKEPESHACLEFSQVIRTGSDEEERTHYFVMGICPRPRCQEATIIYRVERVYISNGNRSDLEFLLEQVIFPATGLRPDLPQEVPAPLRKLYREAASIENLSPNGCAFLTRRILEQALREHFKKPRGRLGVLIDKFLKGEGAPETLHKLMHDIRKFGNIAGHPAQDQLGDWTTVEAVEASYTLDVVAEVLDHLYVKPLRGKEMRERWEAKKRGEAVPQKGTTRVVVGGREKPPTPGLREDPDIPF
jgi:hypothetical protein